MRPTSTRHTAQRPFCAHNILLTSLPLYLPCEPFTRARRNCRFALTASGLFLCQARSICAFVLLFFAAHSLHLFLFASGLILCQFLPFSRTLSRFASLHLRLFSLKYSGDAASLFASRAF